MQNIDEIVSHCRSHIIIVGILYKKLKKWKEKNLIYEYEYTKESFEGLNIFRKLDYVKKYINFVKTDFIF